MYYNVGSSDVSTEVVVTGAVSAAHQLNNHIINNSTHESFINDRASDGRAPRCCISSHYHDKSRRRLVALKTTAANNKCMQVFM